MNPLTESILRHLHEVQAERDLRVADAALLERVSWVKRYQQARFEKTYADLLLHPRYGDAARFFLSELYGPGDFSLRDAQFARIVPSLARLFPQEIARTVEALASLHALSEQLDSEMARHVSTGPLDATRYIAAWQRTGHPEQRARQIDLMLVVGHALDTYTRHPWLGHTLRIMRAPARAAGMAALQTFLESGFDTFRAMRGASEFLAHIETRERTFAACLFGANSADSRAVELLP
jgi:hypothetical protein